MTTILAALLLSSGAAQAQDLEGAYPVQCTENDIELGIKMGHPSNPMNGTLWVDAYFVPTDCTGNVTEAQLSELHDEVLAGCAAHSTILSVCEQVADSVTQLVQRYGAPAPVDTLVVSEVVEDDKGFERARMTIDFGEKANDQTRLAVIQDDGTYFTGRRRGRQADFPGVGMSCNAASKSGGFGQLHPDLNAATIEYIEDTNARCLTATSDDEFQQRWVHLDIRGVSRAATLD